MTPLDVARAAHLAEIQRHLEAGQDGAVFDAICAFWQQAWRLVWVSRERQR